MSQNTKKGKGDLSFFGCLCNVNGSMKYLNSNYDPPEWTLFIESSKLSLKAVLRHNSNHVPPIHVAQSVHKSEAYANTTVLLDALTSGNLW